jgi:hypothetical protein
MAYHSLLRKVITLQRKTKLIPPNSAILVAFSGGIDSSEKLVQTAFLKVREEGREGFLKLEQALQRRVVMKLYGVKNFKEVSKIINRIKKGDKI